MNHNANDLITLFDSLFKQSENTVLIGGYEEPLYLPSDDSFPHHRVIFTRDYFASALHEIAHWCLAGDKRRLLVDYGYWYFPEGRTREQQIQFETAEIKPQAIECIFSLAANSRFMVSQDNFTEESKNNQFCFKQKVAEQVAAFQSGEAILPLRAAIFRDALFQFYKS